MLALWLSRQQGRLCGTATAIDLVPAIFGLLLSSILTTCLPTPVHIWAGPVRNMDEWQQADATVNGYLHPWSKGAKSLLTSVTMQTKKGTDI
jgi:hypothetical protein